MKKKKIVADMAADLFHTGHINLLKNARRYFWPDEVHITVALHTDEQIKSYKGRPPVMDFACRFAILQSCREIDDVMQAPDNFDFEFIDRFDYLVHGDDLLRWDVKLVDFFYSTVKKQGKLILLPYTAGISTTELRKKIGHTI